MLKKLKTCVHCGQNIINEVCLDDNGVNKYFCCYGCQSVYKLLKHNHLDFFYDLKKDSKLTPAEIKDEDSFFYLDTEEFRNKFIQEDENEFTFDFFIEGIHCVACLWLLEQISELDKHIHKSTLNMENSVLSLRMSSEIKLSKVPELIKKFGYRAHPILATKEVAELLAKEEKRDLIRIGVAFACMGNIMLYSLAIYNGADGFFKNYFHFFSFICSLPVFFYCALPFYQSAWISLKNKKLSIDIPIVTSLMIGMSMGILSLLSQQEMYYFDTLTTLVFLLLGARYILKKIQQKALKTQSLANFFIQKTAIQIKNGVKEEVLVKDLGPNDLVWVKAMEIIPIDGKIIKGSSYLNNSLLTGEAAPVFVSKGESVYMGATNGAYPLEISVNKVSHETRFGKILNEIEAGWRTESKISLLTDVIAKRFVLFIFSLSLCFFGYFLFTANLFVALERTLTLLIITCPCALALTTPLALILGLTQMAKAGVIVKNEQVIEKLASAKNIFLDKTGTLTYGDLSVEVIWQDESEPQALALLKALEANSSHPIAKAVGKLEVENEVSQTDLRDVFERPGSGIQGFFSDKLYVVKSIPSTEHDSQIGLFCENKMILKLRLSDRLREDAPEIIQGFKKLGLSPKVLSGDQKAAVLAIGKKLRLGSNDLLYAKSPEQKKEIIEMSERAVMVGDGINDAIALKAAFVGIAVRGSVQISLSASDCYLSHSDVGQVLKLIKSSQHIIKIIYRNLGFSFIYNIIGIYLAANGLVTPLVAAILMPLSSVTVILSTVFGIKRLKALIK